MPHYDSNGVSAEALEAMNPEERVQSVITQGIQMALDFYEENLEPIQTKATDYYHGRPYGDEEDGRSKVVTTEVRDVTMAQMPSLMRIFMGSDRPVEYVPRTEEARELAEQQTDYVRYIISEDNPGYLTLHDWFQDALVRNLGVVKAWWHEDTRVEGAEYSWIDEAGVAALVNDETIDSVDTFEAIERVGPDGQPQTLYNVRVTRTKKYGRVKIAPVPPEEFVFTPNARTLAEAPLVAHVREVPRSYLVDDLGIDEEEVDEAAGQVREQDDEGLRDARQYHRGGGLYDSDLDRDVSQRPVLFAEAYALIDTGEGVALRLFQCIGGSFKIVNGGGLGEVVDCLPFAALTPNPEAHTVVGLSNYDLVGDIQRINSQVLRATLNSLAAAVEPQIEVVEGEINMADLLSPSINKIVRTRRPGMMREVKSTFVGGDTLPVLAYMDELKENRTGVTKAAAGLDADSLQSATKAAVAATLSGSQQRIEMIARTFAETGVKDLFRIILKLVTQHQDWERTVKLRNNWVPVDPRSWDATMDLQVNVALGAGTSEERLAFLQQVLTKQEEYIQNGVPFVDFTNIRYTLGKMLEQAGFNSVDMFFRPWGPEQQQQWEQAQAEKEPEPDPALIVAQAEMMKAEAASQLNQVRAQAEQMKAQIEVQKAESEQVNKELDNERQREKDRQDAATQMQAAELKAQTEREIAAARMEIERQKADALTERTRAEIERTRIQQEEAAARIQIEEARLAHKRRVDAAKLEIEAAKAEVSISKDTLAIQKEMTNDGTD